MNIERIITDEKRKHPIGIGIPSKTLMGLQCPVCNVGVSPDSKVCPNCLRNNSPVEAAFISEEEFVRNYLKRFGYEVDVSKTGGIVVGLNVVRVKE